MLGTEIREVSLPSQYPGEPVISIAKGSDIEEQVHRAVDLLGGIKRFVKKGDRVLLKPNVTGPASYEKGITTNPAVLEAVLKMVTEAGASQIDIGDGTGSAHLGTLKVFDMCGYSYLKEKYDFNFIDLNKMPWHIAKVPEPYIMDEIKIASCVYDNYDVTINLPVMKTHFITGVSLSMKNLKGCIPPAEKRHMHEVGVNKAVADLNTIITTDLIIMDGTVGSEGLGPKEGNPVNLGVVAAGTNAVSMDAVCCAIMGFTAHDIEHIRLVYERGMGEIELSKITVLGDSIESVQRDFAPAVPKLPEGDAATIINGGACSGCISCAVISLSRLVDSGVLDSLRKQGIKITYVIGSKSDQNQIWPNKENVFLLGNCAKKMSDKGTFLAGCAPAVLDINRPIARYYGIDPEILEPIVGQVGK